MTRIFYDTEFLERGAGYPLDLISIGMVRDSDDAEYYAISAELPVEAVRRHDWLKANVWPYLPTVADSGVYLDHDHPDVKPRTQIAREVAAFVLAESNPELWAYYGAHDHVVLAQLFGRMADLPEGMPMFTHDLMQEISVTGVDMADLPVQTVNLHKAIADARWNRDVARYLDGLPVIGGTGRG
jgi:hypothetical protein